MVQSEDSVFDQTVLGLIEQTPNGVVPRTPIYDEAIARLRSAGQIYINADFAGGFATARSLAKLPVFAASNLEAWASGNEGTVTPESNLAVFDRYVASLRPEHRARAETFRVPLAGHPVHHRAKAGTAADAEPANLLFLVPGGSLHRTLPGNYLHGFIRKVASGGWELRVADAERGFARFEAGSKAEAVGKYEELVASVPFLLGELEALGFKLA